jgi:O-acetyl-ADP-ribose deacetylase (regulator of RNase III)
MVADIWQVRLFVGDMLRVKADAVCTSTNPWLSLQAGTGGAVRLFGGHAVQEACDALLAARKAGTGRGYFDVGTAHRTHAGSLPFKAVLHCVAIDAFHGSSEETIAACVRGAIDLANAEGFTHVAMPVFATGNGRFDFRRAVEAMSRAIAEATSPSVDTVSIVVPDVARADEARRTLGARLRGIDSEREEAVRWVTDLYMDLLHGNCVRGGAGASADFLAAARRAVAESDEASLRLLLWEPSWRPRLVAAWLAGVKRVTTLEPLIAEQLFESELTFAGQGYCFALARFGGPDAATALARYLDRWLPRDDCDYDQDWALAALQRLDLVRADAYSAAWPTFAEKNYKDLEGRLRLLHQMFELADRCLAPEPAGR